MRIGVWIVVSIIFLTNSSLLFCKKTYFYHDFPETAITLCHAMKMMFYYPPSSHRSLCAPIFSTTKNFLSCTMNQLHMAISETHRMYSITFNDCNNIFPFLDSRRCRLGHALFILFLKLNIPAQSLAGRPLFYMQRRTAHSSIPYHTLVDYIITFFLKTFLRNFFHYQVLISYVAHV